MRVRRREDSSLELLLDTITNTFGGILFLAILLALLMRTTASRDQEPATDGEPLTEAEAARYQDTIGALEADVAAIRRRMSTALNDAGEGMHKSLVELNEATQRLESALLARAASLQRIASLQREADTTEVRLHDLQAQREAADAEFTDAVTRRDAAVAEAAELSRTALELDMAPGAAVIEQTVGLPRVRPTAKKEVALYLRFGRMYVMHRWAGGSRAGPNTDDFVVFPGHPQVARPKPTAGRAIAAATIDQDVTRTFAEFSTEEFYVTCVVFEDSFDVFQALKAALVRHGFEYRLIARRPGEPVYDIGGTGEAQ